MASGRRTPGLLSELLADAVDELRASWHAHALTLAGIVWGSTAVLLLMTGGAALSSFLDLGLAKTGNRWTIIDDGYTSMDSDGARPGRDIALTVQDLDHLRAGVTSARYLAAGNQEHLAVSTPRLTRVTAVHGASPDVEHIENHQLAAGRWYDQADEAATRQVAVIGAELAEMYFGDASPIGQTLQIDGMPFRVIGVTRPKGFQLVVIMDRHDLMVFIPLSAGRKVMRFDDEVSHIFMEPHRVDQTDQMIEEARSVLWPRHHLHHAEEEAITFTSIPRISATLNRAAVLLQVLLGVVGTLTLSMAGVGVANLMVAMVSGRRREIALRRACGARRGDVVLQFMVETVTVVVVGGLLGVAIGLLLLLGLGAAPLPEMIPAPRPLPHVLLTTFAVLVLTGIGAGLAPARRAARIDPAAALRAI